MGSYYFIYIFGVGSKGGKHTSDFSVINYRSKGVSRDTLDAVSDIYKRSRVTSRAQRLISVIRWALSRDRIPVIIANSHGAVITANALRFLGVNGESLDTVHVYTLGAPRLVPFKTPYYRLARAVNLIHENDRILSYIRGFRWWKPDKIARDTLTTFTKNGKNYSVYVTTASTGCRDVHTCLPLLRLTMPPDMYYYSALR